MPVTVPILVKDPEVTEDKGLDPTEPFVIRSEELFLDGPVSPRVAVLDFDPATGQLIPGARFERGTEPGSGRYLLANPDDLDAHDVSQVSTFGTVLKTIEMFEEPDALGRRIVWAFGAPQLLVVPFAGDWANAYYERESHSLQFFSFRRDGGRPVHTSHSQDIVGHETAHAILDGIAPDLYNALSPQALAIHEAVADLTAVLLAFRCRPLRESVLRHTSGSIANSRAFSGIAEQFAGALMHERPYLRDLQNTKSLRRDAPEGDRVDRGDPHSLSEVLSGALYSVMVRLHDSLRQEFATKRYAASSLAGRAEQIAKVAEADVPQETTGDEIATAIKALVVAAERFKRTIYRGLDYLPPGEVSFADLGRAMLAADQASHPDSSAQRDWLGDEFVRRGIVEHRRDLEVETNFDHAAVADLQLQTLVESDWAAYEFANRNRKLLGIPKGISFKVHPRLDVRKEYWHEEGKEEVRECIYKVSWSEDERNRVGDGLPRRRQISVGTTLAIHWADDPKQRVVRARLTSDRAKTQAKDRDRLLKSLIDRGLLRMGEEALGPDGKLLRTAIRAESIDGLMRVRGAARMLHVASPMEG